MDKQTHIDKIIIHCSATKEGKFFTVQDIDRWHKEMGFDQIGYHYVIYLDGTIHKGRDIAYIGSHCKGYNTGSIGICYIGGLDINDKPKDTRTNQQKMALKEIIKNLQKQFSISKDNIFGHNYFNNKKACPCFDVKKEFV